MRKTTLTAITSALILGAGSMVDLHAAGLFTETDVTTQTRTGIFTYTAREGVGTTQETASSYALAQSAADGAAPMYSGTTNWNAPYYGAGVCVDTEMSAGEMYAAKEWWEVTIGVNLTSYTNAAYTSARLEWPVSKNYNGGLAYETIDVGQELSLGRSNQVLRDFHPPWRTWQDYGEGIDLEGWTVGKNSTGTSVWPKVWMKTQAYEIEPMQIRPDETKAVIGDPVNVINGNTTVDEDDLYIPCPGVSLSYGRSYNSVLNYNGPLGYRWTHSYNWFLSDTNTVFSGKTNTWKVLQGGEGALYWFQSSNNVYTAPFDNGWRLSYTNTKYSLVLPGSLFLTFNSSGKLEAVSNLWQNALALSYTNGLLDRVTHNNGQYLQFNYQSNLLTAVLTPSNGLAMSYSYNAQGELAQAVRTTSSGAHTNLYYYDYTTNYWCHSLTQRVNEVGEVFCWQYATNAAGRTLSNAVRSVISTNYGDMTLVNATNGMNNVVATFARGDTNQVFEYDFHPVLKRITEIKGPGVNAASWAATGRGVKYQQDDYGNTTNTYTYDNSVGQWQNVRTDYDAWHNVTTTGVGFCSAPSNLWTFMWNTNVLLPTQTVDPEGWKMVIDYTNSRVARLRQFNSTTGSYDTIFTYATNGLLSSVTNANGHWVRYMYDQYGFVTSTVPQVGPVVYNSFSRLGVLQSIRLPDGDPAQDGGSGGMSTPSDNTNPTPRFITINADTLGRVTNIVYITNSMSKSFYRDANGRLTNSLDTAGRSTRYTYKPTGKLATVSRTVNGTNLTVALNYDQQFNTLRITDPKGRAVESYKLDVQDRVIAVTNLEGQVLSVQYALDSYIKSINRFDGTTVSNTYNSDGMLSSVTYPSAKLGFTYGKNGVLKTATNATCAITNTYSLAGELTNVTVTGLISVPLSTRYSYLPAGNVSNVVSVGGTNTFGFDNAERVSTITATRFGKAPLCFNVSYNGTNGMVQTITCTNNGLAAEYRYDMWDRLSGIVWSTTNMSRNFGYTYTNSGMISAISDTGIGGNTAYGYDELDRLISEIKTDAGGSNIFSEVIRYDEVGNRTNKIRDGVSVSYSYSNGCDRLAGWSVPQTNLTAQMDVYGVSSENIAWNSHWGQLWVSNQFKATPSGSGSNFWLTDFPVGLGTQKVVAAVRDQAGNTKIITNQFFISVATNSAYLYNAAGCVTNISTRGTQYNKNLGLTWDSQYQLTEVKTNGVSVERNGYDAAGRRVWNWDGTATNYFVYDGSSLVAEVNNTGALKRTYVYAALDVPLAMTVYTGSTAQTYFYLTDKQGAVRGVVNESGSLVEQYRLDAWGKVLGVYDGQSKPIEKSAIGNRLLWQGREYSWSTGLYQMRLRWCDPSVGRFLSNDPIGISGGLNQYVFCGNNPVNFRDPFGLCTERYKQRLSDIDSSRVWMHKNFGSVTGFFLDFMFDWVASSARTAYEAELGGSSNEEALYIGAAQTGAGAAFFNATANLGGIALVEFSPLVVPVVVTTTTTPGAKERAPLILTEMEKAAMRGYPPDFDSAQTAFWRFNVLAQAMMDRGYSPEEIVEWMRKMGPQGMNGGGGW